MATTPTMNSYLENNDFEGARLRLEETAPSWKKRWFCICETIFNRCPALTATYVLVPAENAVKKVSRINPKNPNHSIYQSEDVGDLFDDSHQKCYLFEFFDGNGNSICSKVGTTTRKVQKRLNEELKSKCYVQMGAEYAVIHRVYDCGEIPAEGLESYFRAEYIKRYPDSFKKNDRFINAKFDLLNADKIAARYLEREVASLSLARAKKVLDILQ